MTIAERLNYLLKEVPGKSQAGLARHVGISAPSVSAWCTGETKVPDGANLAKAAQYFGIRIEWLALGQLPMWPAPLPGSAAGIAAASSSNYAAAAIGNRRIPLVSYVQAGRWTEPMPSSASDPTEEWLLTDLTSSANAFALEVKGESMLPTFKPGDRVIIDPAVRPLPGDFVVARNGEEEATFKQYRARGVGIDGAEQFELVPLNDNYPTIRSDTRQVQIIGTMVEHRRYRRTK